MGIFRKSVKPKLASPYFSSGSEPYQASEANDPAIVLLTDVVGPPALRPAAFESLIRTGDPSDALEALTRSRLPELSESKPGLLQRAVEFFITGRRRSSVEQVEMLLHDWTNVSRDVAAYVNARNSVDNARLKSATAPLRYDLEREAIRAETARHRSKHARYEEPRDAPPPPPAAPRTPLQSEQDAEDATVGSSLALMKKVRNQVLRAQAELRSSRAFEDRVREYFGGEVLDAHVARRARERELEERQREIDRLAAEVESLTRDIEEFRAPPAVRIRRHAEELAEADHKVALAKKAAEASEHRSKAKEHRQRKLQPAEEFARRARDRMREATIKRRALDQLRREVDERLRQTADRYGADSEQHATERDMYDELLLDLEENTK